MEAEIRVGFPVRPPRADATTGAALPEAAAALADRIRAEATRLGFDAIGFARAEAHPDGGRLLAWLAEGRHGTMRWMARDTARRVDPGAVLARARTVISVALSYYRGGWPGDAETATLRGRIARYAWGRDYHKRVRKRLLQLTRAIRVLAPSARIVPYVDTGPMLDRGWAERAGIGWIGKNTNVILKRAGSWHFLGELITDLDLPLDAPSKNYCGSCSRCITACPTGAIVGPYQLDARRCISYLTIEHRGGIPLDLRPAIGTRIFGCDDCQEVCPWNRFATPTSNPDFAARPEQQTPELIPLLAMDEAAFTDRFQGTGLRRAGRNRFVRNVAVALGNLGDPRAIPGLRRALLEDPDRFVRGHAAWALGRIAASDATEALRAAAMSERDAEVLGEIEYALGTTTGDRSPLHATPGR